jgi:hypothetical protein
MAPREHAFRAEWAWRERESVREPHREVVFAWGPEGARERFHLKAGKLVRYEGLVLAGHPFTLQLLAGCRS